MSSATITNCHIEDCHGGISVGEGVHVNVEGVTFKNVTTPFDFAPGATGSIRGTRVINDPKLTRNGSSQSGWRKAKGPPLPVYCPKCKTISASRNYVFAGQYWLLWDNQEECSSCHFEGARLSDGAFNLAREVAQIISAPDMTHAMLAALQQVAAEAAAEIVSPDEAIAQAARISPKVAAWLRRGLVAFGLSVFTLLNNAAGIGSFFYSKEQAEMQRSSQTDRILESILQKLSNGDGNAMGSKEPPEHDRSHENRTVPSEKQAPSETGGIKTRATHQVKSPKKPNHVRRQNEQAARRVLMRGDRSGR